MFQIAEVHAVSVSMQTRPSTYLVSVCVSCPTVLLGANGYDWPKILHHIIDLSFHPQLTGFIPL